MHPKLPYPILEIKNLNKTFGETIAVSDLSETFQTGEYLCILGPSGCGKSTLLRIVGGFEEPTSGQILLNGEPVNHLPPERRNVNMVFQNYALFPHMTVFNNVAFGLKMKKQSRSEIERSVQEVLQLVNLEEQAQRQPAQLSGGQQQRVALARALVNRPRVLLLDEPLSALDQRLRVAMQDELRRIQRETDITFLHVTHDHTEAFRMADRVAIMHNGRFLQVGSPQQVYHRPASRFAAQFMGTSNILEATVLQTDPPEIELSGGLRLRIQDSSSPLELQQKRTLCIRPEQIELHTDRPARETNVLQANLIQIRPLGSDLECTAEIGSAQLLVRTLNRGTHATLHKNDLVFLYISPADIVLFPASSNEDAP
ncbi:MAG: ABC transporter ATP-binding protein [bacterium]|nr:ABC transporter ATP-binding protein [bacterium]